MKRIFIASLCTMALAAGTTHADSKHEGHKTAASKKEQKPWGIAGDAKAVKRTIELSMTDNMRFTPDRVEVKQGEVVKFVVKNSGKLLHELVIGTTKDFDQHAKLMQKFPNMEHAEANMVHVKPGASGELIWNFNRPGEFDFACLVDGHYQAGMVGKVKVVATKKGV
jgi:uncharacterized cupredoxin-like copper-binding protein